MVKPLGTTLLLAAELLYAIKFYKKAIKKHLLYDAAIDNINMSLKYDLIELNEVLSTVPHTRQVEDLCETEAIRDYLFEMFTAKVRSFSRRRKSELKNAYLQLRDVLNSPDATAIPLAFEEQTEKYEKLFAKLGQTKNQRALATLRIYELYQELKNTHEDCVVQYRALSDDYAMDFLMLRKVKLTAAQHLNELMSAIHTLDKNDKAGLHADLIKQFNEITFTMLHFISDRIPNGGATGHATE